MKATKSTTSQWKALLKELNIPEVEVKSLSSFTKGVDLTSAAQPQGPARQGAAVGLFDALIKSNQQKAARHGN